MGGSYGNRTYLSYHRYKDYKECPLRYKWKYITRKVSTVPDVPQYRFLGILWNDLLEKFYLERKFLLGPAVRDWMGEETERLFEVVEKKLAVTWAVGERAEYKQQALDHLEPILQAIKKEKLIAKKVSVELPMYANVSKYVRLGGRVDLILDREGSVRIVDFKGTKHSNGKYLHEDQLRWYAILYQTMYRDLPEHLGFWMLRFERVDWIDPDPELLKELLKEVIDSVADIRAEKFDATPSNKVCRFCDYRDQCSAKDEFDRNKPKREKTPKVKMFEDDGLGEDVILDV